MVLLALTLRFAVYSLFGKSKIKFGQKTFHPQKYELPYTYDFEDSIKRWFYVQQNLSDKARIRHRARKRRLYTEKPSQNNNRLLL